MHSFVQDLCVSREVEWGMLHKSPRYPVGCLDWSEPSFPCDHIFDDVFSSRMLAPTSK